MTNHESGHYKNITALETLIAYVTALGATYNPSNEMLTIAGLQQLLARAKEGYRSVTARNTDFNNAVGERMLRFEPLRPYATQIASAFKVSSKAKAPQHDDVATILNKIRGLRAGKRKSETALSPETPLPVSISVSQQSFDMRVDHYQKLLYIIKAEPTYNPNENFLKLPALEAFGETLSEANTKVSKAFEDVRNARITRDTILYGPLNSIFTLQKDVKEYIKSVYKANSTAYKQASAIRFRKPANRTLKLNA